MKRLMQDHGGLTIAIVALAVTIAARLLIDLLVEWPTIIDWIVSIALAAIVCTVVAKRIQKQPE